MRLRDRGFALILVLVATATVFALAIQSGAVVRATTLETVVLQERQAAQRGAKTAASLLIKSMLGEPVALAEDGPGSASEDSAPAAPTEDDLDLPPIVKALLGDALGDLEEEAQEQFDQDRENLARTAQGGGVSGMATSVSAFKLLSKAIASGEPTEIQLPDDNLTYEVTLADAGGQLPINTATERQLLAYLRAVGLEGLQAQRITDQILDWRDEDSVTRRFGAERAAYESQGITPRNQPLKTIEELLYLPSMTRELFDRIAPDLSIAGDNQIHAGSASREVLLAIPDISPNIADRIIALRASGELTDETLDEALPATASDAREVLRASAGNVLRLSVVARGEAIHRFTGIAIIDEGRIAALGVRPL